MLSNLRQGKLPRQFIAYCNSQRITKIGSYLPSYCTNKCRTFHGPPCVITITLVRVRRSPLTTKVQNTTTENVTHVTVLKYELRRQKTSLMSTKYDDRKRHSRHHTKVQNTTKENVTHIISLRVITEVTIRVHVVIRISDVY